MNNKIVKGTIVIEFEYPFFPTEFCKEGITQITKQEALLEQLKQDTLFIEENPKTFLNKWTSSLKVKEVSQLKIVTN